MQKSSIHPAILQPFFESARNAANNGQAQWFTPPEWGKVLSRALNGYRPVLVDLNCGNGQLLTAARKHSRLLGCDIQPADGFVPADVTVFYPLLRTVEWQTDCFVLNPPWDLHWYRERLDGLLQSECVAVVEAYLEQDERLGADTIDSTAATLMIALDRMSPHGEGFLIANEATLQRLIFNGPHAALSTHIWAHLVVEGNICMSKVRKVRGQGSGPDTPHLKPDTFRTGILWFARAHQGGPKPDACTTVRSLAEAEQFTEHLHAERLRFRTGAQTRDYLRTENSVFLWEAAAEEWARINPHTAARAPHYNLWLEHGFIRTNLSLYDTASGRVSKDEAAKLDALSGTEPLKLVVMKEQRRALQTAAFGGTWRVCPQLQAAVQQALDDYNAERTPLYPLSKIQRLGFLDEHDFITCLQPLDNFRRGQKYALRSTTVIVKRQGHKVNLSGEREAVELDGQELAFFITDGAGAEKCFMEARLREEGVTVNLIKPGLREATKRLTDDDLMPCPVDYTVQQLVEDFDIPEVPDVALVFPDQYKNNLVSLEEIERLVNA